MSSDVQPYILVPPKAKPGSWRRKQLAEAKDNALNDELVQFLTATQQLTDPAFEEAGHASYFRKQFMSLVKLGLKGDIRALELYFKRYDAWRTANKPTPEPDRTLHSMKAFVQDARIIEDTAAEMLGDAPPTGSTNTGPGT